MISRSASSFRATRFDFLQRVLATNCLRHTMARTKLIHVENFLNRSHHVDKSPGCDDCNKDAIKVF